MTSNDIISPQNTTFTENHPIDEHLSVAYIKFLSLKNDGHRVWHVVRQAFNVSNQDQDVRVVLTVYRKYQA